MRRLVGLALVAGLFALALPLAARAQSDQCAWLAGDFHVHTVYSHDSYGGPDDPGTPPEEFYTFGWTPGQQGAIAESRGLDFIAITDHDNVDGYLARNEEASGVGLYESGWGKTDQLDDGNPLVWIPDYEANVSGAGHAQMHGATHTYPKASPQDMAAALRADGGAFQINHPADGDWHTDTGEYKFGDFTPDALEIWNIGAWLYHPPFPATNDHEFTPKMYDEFLDQGAKIAATGGSDNHWRSTTAAQGVGQPTTWVYACGETTDAMRTPEAIIEGVKAGRTFISNQPPAYQGATLKLYADHVPDAPGPENQTFESMLGSTVRPGSDVVAVVENADGATLRLITNGGQILEETTISTFNFSLETTMLPNSTWVRAELFYEDGQEARQDNQALCDTAMEVHAQLNEAPGVIHEDAAGNSPFEDENYYCQNRLAMQAMTSPIYFDRSSALIWAGDTTTTGPQVTLAADLRNAFGEALANEPVTFNFNGLTRTVTTDQLGRATLRVKSRLPAGQYPVTVDFADGANELYEGSQLLQTITITAL